MPRVSILAVSDGRAGIARQAASLSQALAHALAGRGAAADVDQLTLQPRGLQLALPPDLWPAPLAALPAGQRAKLAGAGAAWPDVWIAAGRRSIPYSRRVRRWSGGRSLVVQIQHPRTGLAAFDLVVPPEHDRLGGPNVFPILGPPVWWSEEEIAAARAAFPELGADPAPRVLVAVGGRSRTHRMDAAATERIAAAARSVAAVGGRAWITVSRRTPPPVRAELRLLAGETGARFWEAEGRDGRNPYLAWLASCDAALVTEDSANLLADPAFFARPIHLVRLAGGSPRFDRLHQAFIARGAARWFDGTIETRSYPPIREAERAAQAIMQNVRAVHHLQTV
jgi:hypothetical protein